MHGASLNGAFIINVIECCLGLRSTVEMQCCRIGKAPFDIYVGLWSDPFCHLVVGMTNTEGRIFGDRLSLFLRNLAE